MRKKLQQKGFTLIELMVVIVIVGILAAVAIPKFLDASAKAKMSEAPTVVASYESAQLAYLAETSSLGAIGSLVFESPSNSKWFTYQENGTGTFQAVASATIGDFPQDEYLQSVVDASGDITHSWSSGGATAGERYLPNFVD